MRDPSGAIVALARPGHTPPAGPTSPEVVFRSHNGPQLERTLAAYSTLLGWDIAGPDDMGTAGVIHPFGWERGEEAAGAFLDTAGRPGVHPHWLHHFAVPSLDAAITEIRAAGGLVLEPIELPNGIRIAVCDDPQGAAFAIQQAAQA